MQLFVNKNISDSAPVVNPKIIFVNIGQSNIQGRDGDISNPSYPFPSHIGGLEWNGETLIGLNTLQVGAARGSHVNYFSDKIHELIGAHPIVISAGAGGSGLTPTSNADRNWGDLDILRSSAIAKISSLQSVTESLPICALWCQGETDAEEMDSNGAYTSVIVKAAMQDVIDWWQSSYPDAPFLISQTGRPNSSDTAGYSSMRTIQNEIVSENTGVYMAFDGAVNFPSEGKMYDNLHYDYDGLSEMGEAFAIKYNEIS